ncbi:MAG: NADH-quinone oxidoreductase subunit A [Chloroflexi bacterium]|jgi:NADH-quinone oxidoreductase subunit A|nr:NADH-quinone oxidoreductase subunit A [Chloroflexota bacterium]HZW32901.1 NADH-quinone oxidoreductase subunit A [Isosphaeraceae bacterium]
MPTEYLPIFVLAIIAVGFGLLVLAIAAYLGPRHAHSRRMVPYESGITPQMSARIRFPVKFSLIAMLFIVFDVEAVFFYPWAVIYRQLRLFGFLEMLIFIGILLVGYFYILKKGALEWE